MLIFNLMNRNDQHQSLPSLSPCFKMTCKKKSDVVKILKFVRLFISSLSLRFVGCCFRSKCIQKRTFLRRWKPLNRKISFFFTASATTTAFVCLFGFNFWYFQINNLVRVRFLCCRFCLEIKIFFNE